MLSKATSSTIFLVFGMTRPGIEPRSTELLTNTLTTRRVYQSQWWWEEATTVQKPEVFSLSKSKGSPYGVMANMLDCGIIISEFELQWYNYFHFRNNTLVKCINFLILLQGWFWYWITHESWYAIKSKETKSSLEKTSSIQTYS